MRSILMFGAIRGITKGFAAARKFTSVRFFPGMRSVVAKSILNAFMTLD